MSNSLKQFFLGGFSLSVVNISGKIVNLLILPIITLYLIPSDFGMIAVYMLIISVLGMLYNPGIISVTLRLYYDNNDDSEENRTLVGSSLIFLIFFPLLILFISLIFQETLFNLFFKDFNFWPYGFLAVLASFTPQVVRLWSALWVAKHQTKRVAIASMVRIILAITISLILIVLFKQGAMGRITGLFVGNIAIFIIALYDIIKYTKFQFSIKILIQTLVLGLPLIFSVFSYVIMESSDKYMLERMVGLHELGIYDIAYTYSAIPLFILVGFSQVWQPVFFENMKKGADKILLKLSSYYICILFLISLSVLFFSNEVFNIFIDAQYINAIKIVPWIVVGIFFLGLSNLIASIYSYQKRFREIGVIALLAAVINIILNYFFIKSYGIIGASVASALTYLIYFLILLFQIKKYFLQIFSLKIFSLTSGLLLFSGILLLYINYNLFEFDILMMFVKIIVLTLIIIFLFLIVIEPKDKKKLKLFFKTKFL